MISPLRPWSWKGKSGGYYVFVVPIEKEVDRKAAAKVCRRKNSRYDPCKGYPTKITGYVSGGCSPLGMKKTLSDSVMTQSAENFDEIYVSGGRSRPYTEGSA